MCAARVGLVRVGCSAVTGDESGALTGVVTAGLRVNAAAYRSSLETEISNYVVFMEKKCVYISSSCTKVS